jgi:histidine triad (HIT) family protein
VSDSCIFCRIARGEIPAARVLEDEHVIAFRDVNPQAPVHVLVAPKTHVTSLVDLEAGDQLWNRLVEAAQRVAAGEGLSRGFRLVVNHGADGGQTVDHLHIHVLGGRALQWPPG